ncbi:DUF805 domain-containing protein [Terrabacter sp. GCM10028922]|uniref:DUF805 domain-containing protein n=1 Tax=Terrabacter sp. GCM10028922 TaxID=3273428 RepID=UPI003623EBAC
MSFVDAVKTVLSKYATFSGRARRSEYWFWALALVIVSFVTNLIDRGLGTEPGRVGIISGLVALATLLPNLAVLVRRLHDTSRSGWWLLIVLVPIVGAIVLLVFAIQDSHGDNAYGPSPKAVGQDGAPVLQ